MRRILIIGSVGFSLGVAALEHLKDSIPQVHTIDIPFEEHHLNLIYYKLEKIVLQTQYNEQSLITRDFVNLYNFDVIDRFDYLPP